MHEMNDERWLAFFRVCAETFLVEGVVPNLSPTEGGSWVCWTTFDRLEEHAGYWYGPLPTAAELYDSYLGHGRNWGQYFHYAQLAHVIVPRLTAWERAAPGTFERGEITQDIEALSARLTAIGVPHRLTPIVLEIKCY